MLGSKEFYDVMALFEKTLLQAVFVSAKIEREPKENWKKQYYYTNGEVNNLFKVFLWGYQCGKAEYQN